MNSREKAQKTQKKGGRKSRRALVLRWNQTYPRRIQQRFILFSALFAPFCGYSVLSILLRAYCMMHARVVPDDQ
jgi:hypothetical protein